MAYVTLTGYCVIGIFSCQVHHTQQGAVVTLGYITACSVVQMKVEEGLVAMDTSIAEERMKLTVKAIERLGTIHVHVHVNTCTCAYINSYYTSAVHSHTHIDIYTSIKMIS